VRAQESLRVIGRRSGSGSGSVEWGEVWPKCQRMPEIDRNRPKSTPNRVRGVDFREHRCDISCVGGTAPHTTTEKQPWAGNQTSSGTSATPKQTPTPRTAFVAVAVGGSQHSTHGRSAALTSDHIQRATTAKAATDTTAGDPVAITSTRCHASTAPLSVAPISESGGCGPNTANAFYPHKHSTRRGGGSPPTPQRRINHVQDQDQDQDPEQPRTD